MANNSFVVITLSSSDEDSNKKVEIAPSAQNDVKPKKVTARKSTHSKASITSTATKDKPLPEVPKPSTSKMGKSTINVEIKSTNSAEPKVGPYPEKKSARKSFQNSNSESAPKVVTSPKLSLKRKKSEVAARTVNKSSTTAIPLPYPLAEPPEKKVKLNSTAQSSIAIPLPYYPRELFVKKPELSSSEPNAKVPLSQNNVAPDLSSHAQQKDASENSMPWNSSDNNITRFKKLMEFSESFMSATPEEKCIIVKNFHKLLDKADTLFVNSAEFRLLMDDAVNKIKASKDTFIHLQTIRTELKAYKRRKNSSTPAKVARHPSSSSEQSEAFASYPKPPLPSPAKEVPAPSLGVNLASALHSITANFKRTESLNSNNDPFPSIPCSSKQADIVENLRLSMPVSNGVKLPIDLISTLRHADVLEELCMPVPVSNDSPSTSGGIDKAANPVLLPTKETNPVPLPTKETNPVPLSTNCNAPLEIDLDIEEEQKDALFATLDLQSVGKQKAHKSEDEVVNGEHKVRNLPSIPVKEEADHESKSSESKSDKIEKRVKYLEAHLKKLDKKIKKLQSRELSLDDMDDEDSTYIMEDRYKKKFQKVWVTLCKIKKRSSVLLGREIDKRFTYEGSRHSTFNKAIDKLINKRKPAEKFPNFNEVHNLLELINEESQLALSSSEIYYTAREAFEDVVRELKKRRERDDAQDFGCYLTDVPMETDPAEQDEELKQKLTKSAEEGEERIQALYAKYASLQPKETSDDGSNCEERSVEGRNTDGDGVDSDGTAARGSPGIKEEPMSSSLEDNPVAIEVEANPYENTNLPDTDPATPDTDPAVHDSDPATPDTDPAVHDSDPATPDTDAHEDEERVVAQPVARTHSTDVIDIGDSCSSASTEPGSAATERRSTFTVDVDTEKRSTFVVNADTEKRPVVSTFTVNAESRILIDDMIEIEEDQPPNSDDSLPSLEELLKLSKVK